LPLRTMNSLGNSDMRSMTADISADCSLLTIGSALGSEKVLDSTLSIKFTIWLGTARAMKLSQNAQDQVGSAYGISKSIFSASGSNAAFCLPLLAVEHTPSAAARAREPAPA